MKRESDWPVVEICISPSAYRVLQPVVPKVRDVSRGNSFRHFQCFLRNKDTLDLSASRRSLTDFNRRRGTSFSSGVFVNRSKVVNPTVGLAVFPSLP